MKIHVENKPQQILSNEHKNSIESVWRQSTTVRRK